MSFSRYLNGLNKCLHAACLERFPGEKGVGGKGGKGIRNLSLA